MQPDTIDFFDGWTFARFLTDDVLALAFESDQPWAEYGSYGDRYGGVQIMVREPGGPQWTCRSMEYDHRAYDERFIPHDVAWHPRGVLAWLCDGLLSVQVLRRPRGPVQPALTPERDSDTGPWWTYEAAGDWRRLSLDGHGAVCRAEGDADVLLLDLDRRRCSADGTTWAPMSAGSIWDSTGS